MTGEELTDQIALVTGGGRGIGANIARELTAAGARVAVAARTRDQVAEVANEIGGLALELDVTDRSAVEGAVAEAERELGPLTLLVANAGIGGPDGATWEVEPEDWWRVQEVNVRGVHGRSAPKPLVISVCTRPGLKKKTGMRSASSLASVSP